MAGRRGFLNSGSGSPSNGDSQPLELGGRWSLPVPLLVLGIMLAPFVVAAIGWVGSGYDPIQDQAVAALRVSDIWSWDPPLVGAFSRYGWSHPGPVWFGVLAVFAGIGGDSGMVIGSILMSGAILAGTVVLVWRRLGTWAASVAVGAAGLTVAGVGAFGVVVPWNPHLAWALFGLFLVVLLLACRTRRASDLCAGLFLCGILLQLHVGYVLLAGLPLLAATALFVGSRIRRPSELLREFRPFRAWGWIAAAIVVWIPPLSEQLIHGRSGNLALIAEWFMGGGSTDVGESVGLGGGAALVGGALSSGGLGYAPESLEPFSGWAIPGSAFRVLPVVLLVGFAAVLAYRRRDDVAIRSVVFIGVVAVAGVLSASLVVGDRWPYLFVWRYPLVFFVAATALAVAVDLLARGRARQDGRWSSTRLPVVIAAVGFSLVTAVVLSSWDAGVIRDLEPQVDDLIDGIATPSPDSTPIVREFGPILDGVGDAVLLHGERAGWDLRVDSKMGFKYGNQRVATSSPSEVWPVTQGSAATSIAVSLPDATVLSQTTPLTVAEEATLTSAHVDALHELAMEDRMDLVDSLRSPLVGLALADANVFIDPETLRILEELNAKVTETGIERLAVVAITDSEIENYANAETALRRRSRSPEGG